MALKKEAPTIYTDSKGETRKIADMDKHHLVNALVKTARKIDNENYDDREIEKAKAITDALKAEVIRRLS